MRQSAWKHVSPVRVPKEEHQLPERDAAHGTELKGVIEASLSVPTPAPSPGCWQRKTKCLEGACQGLGHVSLVRVPK